MAELTQNFINPETDGNIRRLDWQLSTRGFGRVAQGVDDISQSILLAIGTQKGSDPFRPEFGSDIWEHVSTPLQIAIPNMVLAITQAIARWVPQIQVRSISGEYRQQPDDVPGLLSGVVFNIGWSLRGDVDGQTDLLLGLGDDIQNDTSNPVAPNVTIMVLGTEDSKAITTEMNEYIDI